MTNLPLNPFRPTRWEHQRDGHQLIWFTKTAQLLAGDKPVYVRGSRGSGKTTLLKSVCWEDLVDNTSLKMQKRFSDFTHVGVYLRFPDHLNSSLPFSPWIDLYETEEQSKLEYHRFFSYFVELNCCERALEACHHLRVSGNITMAAGREIDLVHDLVLEFPNLERFLTIEAHSFYDLARLFRHVVRDMTRARTASGLRELADSLPPRHPGELLNFLTKKLSDGARFSSPINQKNPSFKFCLDDCEVLTSLQQKSLNTLVRTCRFPVSWVVSAVGALFDSTNTFIEQQPLTDADRRVISLDERDERDFATLCESVVSLRLLFSVSEAVRLQHQPKTVPEFFSLERRLGSRSVNDFMHSMAAASARPMAQILREGAIALADVLSARKRNARLRVKHDVLPLYEAYLLLLWQGKEDSFKTHFDRNDIPKLQVYAKVLDAKNGAAWLRRKQKGALLHFAAKLGVKRLPICGVEVVTSLADGTIRDFLEIMGEIYEVYAKKHKLDASDPQTLERFVVSGSKIGNDVQIAGVHAASESYIKGVNTRAERNADVISRFLEALGSLTAILQSNPDDPSVLATAERGIFVVRIGTSGSRGPVQDERNRLVWDTIRLAELAGYIRTIESPGRSARYEFEEDGLQTIAFRLHRRFSPYFRFSYRGSYERISIEVADLWKVCDPTQATDPIGWAASFAAARRDLLTDLQQLPLRLEIPGEAGDGR